MQPTNGDWMNFAGIILLGAIEGRNQQEIEYAVKKYIDMRKLDISFDEVWKSEEEAAHLMEDVDNKFPADSGKGWLGK